MKPATDEEVASLKQDLDWPRWKDLAPTDVLALIARIEADNKKISMANEMLRQLTTLRPDLVNWAEHQARRALAAEGGRE